MSYEVKTGMVVGTANPRVWSQVAIGAVPGGELLILVSLEYAGEGDALEVAAVGGGILEAVKQKCGAVPAEMGAMKEEVAKLANELGEGLTWSVGVGRTGKSELLVVGMGEVEMYLARGKQLGKIFSGSREAAGVKGEIKEGDTIMLVTTQLVRAVGVKGLTEAMASEGTMEQLAVLVHGQDDSSRLAGVMGRVVQIGQKTKDERRKVGIDWGGIVRRVRRVWKRPIAIKKEQKERNMAVGAILLAMLVLGVGMGVVKRAGVVKERELTKLVEQVESRLTEARTVADLNPDRAKGLLSEARGEVESYLMQVEDEKYRGLGGGLLAKIDETETVVFRQIGVEVTTLVELSLLNIDESEVMAGDGKGNLILIDENGEKLAGVNVGDKSSWEVELGQGGVEGVGVYDGRAYWLAAEGVRGVRVEGGEVREEIARDELWATPSEIGLFAGNVYILDTTQGEIWKYPRITEGFGARRRWLGAGIVLDLSKVVDMEVDGDVWIVTSTGKLERYSRGVPVEFGMEGFPAKEGGGLVKPTAVATTEEKVYVLEAGSKRVVVFEKEAGKYEKQLVNEVFAEGKELVVYENRGYVLLPDRIVWFGL